MSVAAHDSPIDLPVTDQRLLPRFRVLTIEGVRRAFKLEPVYWSALETLAARRHRTLAAEVGERLKLAPPETNHSAFLRASISGDLYDLWRTQQSQPSTQGWVGVVDAIGEPAFAATPGGRVSALNQPMRALLRSRGFEWQGEPGGILFDLAAGALALLRDPRRQDPVISSACFRVGSRSVNCRSRLVPSRTTPGQGVDCLLIGFSAPL